MKSHGIYVEVLYNLFFVKKIIIYSLEILVSFCFGSILLIMIIFMKLFCILPTKIPIRFNSAQFY